MTEFSKAELKLIDQETKKEKEAKRKTGDFVLEQQMKARQMFKEGFSTEEIAVALGFGDQHLAMLLDAELELGGPEQILQENLKKVVSLITLSEAMYRDYPSRSNSESVVSFISTAQSLITDLYSLKDKEESFKVIVHKVLQVLIRDMIKAMMEEVKRLHESEAGKTLRPELAKMSSALGVKFDEAYRKSTERLAEIIGISAEAKTKSLAVTTDEDKNA